MRHRGAGAVVWSAAVGAALWVLLGLANFGIAHLSLRLGPLIDLIVVPTVPGSAWVRHAPWGALLPLMGGLVFGGLLALGYALVVRLRGWNVTPRALRVIIAWFLAVLAGAMVAVVWDLGAIVAEHSPLGFQWVFREDLPALMSSATVGLIWGWLPGLLISWGERRLTRLVFVVVVIATLVVAAAASTVVITGLSASSRRPLPVVTPTPTPTPTPPPRVAPTPAAPVTGACTDADVSISASGIQGALGHRALTLVLVNRSSASCVIDGYPDLAFAGDNGGELPVAVTHGSSYLAEDPGAKPVSLAPGTTANATLEWGAGAQGTPATTMLVAPYAGAERGTIDTRTDITDQSTVTVSAWAAAARG